MDKTKIFRLSDLEELKKNIQGKNTNLAYGHFSVIHPGHIRYLKNASRNSELLIVALQDDQDIRGSNRFRYNEEERSYGLLSTNLCDYVLILEKDNLSTAIREIFPKVVFLGTNYQSRNISKEVQNAQQVAKEKGIEISYSSGNLEFASSDIFRLDIEDRLDEKRSAYLKTCESLGITKEKLLSIIEKNKRVNITVLGDTIVDEYAACEALGMSGEAPVLVVKELELETFIGGVQLLRHIQKH